MTITRSGKKITETVSPCGMRQTEAFEEFSFDDPSNPQLPVCGAMFEGWFCVSITFDDQEDGQEDGQDLFSCTARFVEAIGTEVTI